MAKNTKKGYIVRGKGAAAGGTGVYTYAREDGGTETEWYDKGGIVSRKERLAARRKAHKWETAESAQKVADELNACPFYRNAKIRFEVLAA